MAEAENFFAHLGFALPPFAFWSPREFRSQADEVAAIIAARMGWDITDYGQGDFARLGLVLFALRNGPSGDLRTGDAMAYAEMINLAPRPDQPDAHPPGQGRGHHQSRRRPALRLGRLGRV
jgi:D-lyxose ketol-isomerase